MIKFHSKFERVSMKWHPSNGMMLTEVTLVTSGKDQFKIKVKVENEKHIYIIPDKHSYHDLS